MAAGLKARSRLACVERNLQLDARGELADADFGAVFADFGWPAHERQGKRFVRLPNRGNSRQPQPWPNSAGSATLKLEQGGVAGVNLEQALRRSQRRPIDVARDLRVGETAFDRLSLELAFGQGVAHVVNGDLVAQGVAADLQGAIDLAAQSWNLRLNATQTDATGAGIEGGGPSRPRHRGALVAARRSARGRTRPTHSPAAIDPAARAASVRGERRDATRPTRQTFVASAG